jgi:hypothetical protein
MKTTLLTLAVFFSVASFAQNGEIIHEVIQQRVHRMKFDFDHSGNNDDTYPPYDLYFHFFGDDVPWVTGFDIDCEYWIDSLGYCDYTSWTGHIHASYGDTIQRYDHAYWHGDTWLPLGSLYGSSYAFPYDADLYSTFKQYMPDGNECYGWIHYRIEAPNSDFNECWITFYDYAYCTEPGYPLIVGQTSYDWNAVEQTVTPEPTIHPNPSEGILTVSGKDIKEVEVFNALGQQILTQLVNGGTANIDLESQPAGVYFVNVTDQNGKGCVKKVVKR